jgi:hypothetical protein
MSNSFLTIDPTQLTSIVGGANARSKLLLDTLEKRYGDDGVVSFIGRPKFTTGANGISHATGKFDVNGLWGGDTKRSFSANVDLGQSRVTGLHTKVISAE